MGVSGNGVVRARWWAGAIRRAGMAAMLAMPLLASSPARAIFIPSLQMLTQKDVEAEERKGYWASAGDRLVQVFRTPVGGLAASFDYRYNQQDLTNSFLGSTFSTESKLNSYSLRPEFVLTNWWSVYGIAALYDGSSKGKANGVPVDIDLDGWGAGVGTTVSLGLPPWRPSWWQEGTIDPFFVLPDVNWTYNEFQGINNNVNTVNVTTRIGAGARTDLYNWGLYGGPMYQSSTRDLSVPLGGFNFAVQSEPRDAWSGVIGAFFGLRISRDPRAQLRPTLLATVEGGVGNRQGVLVSLRYEYDPFF